MPKSAFRPDATDGVRGWFVVFAFVFGLCGICLGLAAWPAERARVKWTESDVQQAYKKINALTRGPAAGPQLFYEREANALFGSVLRKKSASGVWGVSLISAQAVFRPGAVSLHAVSMWGPVHFGRRQYGPLRLTHELNLLPVTEDGRINWVVRGGRLGHLPLPGPSAYLAGMFFEPLRAVLLPDRAVLAGIKRFELEEGRVVIGFSADR